MPIVIPPLKQITCYTEVEQGHMPSASMDIKIPKAAAHHWSFDRSFKRQGWLPPQAGDDVFRPVDAIKPGNDLPAQDLGVAEPGVCVSVREHDVHCQFEWTAVFRSDNAR